MSASIGCWPQPRVWGGWGPCCIALCEMMLVWEVSPSHQSGQRSIITIGTGPGVTALPWARPSPTLPSLPSLSRHEYQQTWVRNREPCTVQIWCLQNKFANYDGNKRGDGNNGLSQNVNNKMFIIEQTVKHLLYLLKRQHFRLQTWTHTITKMPHNRRV